MPFFDLHPSSSPGLRALLVLICALAIAPGPDAAGALSAQETGRIAGHVTGADDGAPLSGAAVRLDDRERGTYTDPEGDFVLLSVPAGSRRVTVTMLGYRSRTVRVDVPPGGTAELDVGLPLRPLEVGGIQVSVLRPDMQPRAELTDREVRESNPKDSGELLRDLGGVSAARRGPLGLDPVVRGLRETEVGTYLDGARMFPAGPARMDSPLTHLDPSAVQDIEVVKGPYALTWGAGNLSAIRVETRQLPLPGFRGLRGSVTAGYDTNLQASETYGSVAGRTGGVSYWAHGAWREGNDYDAGDGAVVPGDYTSSEGRAKVGYDVTERSRLTVSGGYQDQGPIDYPGRLLTAKFFYSSNLAAEWVTEGRDGMLRRMEVSAYRNDVSHAMDNRGKPTRSVMEERTPPFSLNVEVDSDMEVRGGRAVVDLAGGPWDVRLGTDVYSANRDADRQIMRREDELPGGPPAGTVLFDDQLWPDATISDLGLFARTRRTVGSGVRLSGTLRLDRVWADADTPSEAFLEYLARTGRSRDLEQSETNVSAAATVSFDLNPHWDLSLGLGSAVRAADATERYSDHLQATKAQTAAEFMGTPDLDPERSTQADVWIEATYPRTALQLNLFGRKVGDYITLALTDESKRLPLPIFPTEVFRYVNGEAEFFGGEASLTYGFTDVLTARARTSWVWGEETLFLAGDGAEVEEPAFGMAPLRGSAGLRYEEPGGRFFVEGTSTLVAEQDRVAESRGESPTDGYALFDLRAGWAPLPRVNLRFGVQNLLDESYVNHLNSRNPYSGQPIPEPGRIVFGDVSYAF